MLRPALALVVVTVLTVLTIACTANAPALPPPGPNAVDIALKTDPPGATVTIDGVPVGPSPLTVKLNPGPHRVRAMMNGYTASPEQKIQVGATEPRAATLSLIASH